MEELEFLKGDFIDLFFPIEGMEYKLQIIDVDAVNDVLALKIGQNYLDTFYKGEDNINCKYVHENIIYDFASVIYKLDTDRKNPYKCPVVFIKKPDLIEKQTVRSTDRIDCNIPAEFLIERFNDIDFSTKKNRGFGIIEDISFKGLSFTSKLPIPEQTTIFIFIDGTDEIVLKGEVKKAQRKNNSHVYGVSIVEFLNNSESKYRTLLKRPDMYVKNKYI